METSRCHISLKCSSRLGDAIAKADWAKPLWRYLIMGLRHLVTCRGAPVRHAHAEPPREARKEHRHQEAPVHPNPLYRSRPKTRDPSKRLCPVSCQVSTSRGLGLTRHTRKSRAMHTLSYGPAHRRILATNGYLRLETS